MATREENLKKINTELEKLDDEQLEEIAGGKIRPIMFKSGTESLIPTLDDDNLIVAKSKII